LGRPAYHQGNCRVREYCIATSEPRTPNDEVFTSDRDSFNGDSELALVDNDPLSRQRARADKGDQAKPKEWESIHVLLLPM
jgi:hypothetical protein